MRRSSFGRRRSLGYFFLNRSKCCWAILLAFIPKVEAIIHSVPTAVIGGIWVLLYGMIGAVGIRTLVDNKVDFAKTRNLIVASVILVFF